MGLRLSLRGRLVLLVLAAVLPAAGVLLYTGLDHRAGASEQARDEALRTARLVAGEQDRILREASVLLATLSLTPAVRAGDAASCGASLAASLPQHPEYANLGAVDPAGRVACSAVPQASPVDASDRAWFRLATATKAFTVGEYQIGRITGRAVVVAALPILDADRIVARVLFAAIDLARLSETVARAELPAGTVFTVFDRAGVVLVRSSEAERFVGKAFPDAGVVTAAPRRAEGTAEVGGVDGVRRLYGIVRLAPGGAAVAAVGIPTEVAYAEANRDLARSLLLLAFVGLFGMALAHVIANRSLLRPIARLVGAADRLGRGDAAARAEVTARGELGDLGRRFDDMAAALQTRSDAEARMRAAQHRLAEVLESVTDAVAVFDRTFRCVYANAHVAEMTGRPIADVVGKSPMTEFPEGSSAFHDAYRRVMETRVAEVVEGYFEPWDRWFEASVFPAPEGIAVFYHEVTDRMRAEQELREAQEHTRHLLDGLSCFAGLLAPDGTTLQVNKATALAAGEPAGSITGPPFWHLLDRFDAEDAGRLRAMFERALAGETVRADVKIERPGGSLWLDCSFSPLLRPGGEVRYVVASGIDVTERKRAEEESGRLAAVVQSSRDAIITGGIDGTIRTWNPAAERMFGWTAGEMVGRSIMTFTPPEEVEATRERVAALLGGDAVSFEAERIRKDGSRFPASINAFPIVDGSGTVIGISGIVRDLSAEHAARREREAVERRLAQSERLESLGQLAGGIAHDFNNLLAVILNYAEFVADGLVAAGSADLAAVRGDVAEITRAAERAAALTRQLLIFGRREVVNPAPVDLNEVVEGLEKMLARTIGEHIELRTDLAGDLWAARADPNRVEQVLVNLAVNARDAMPGGGTLLIETGNVELDAAFVAEHGIEAPPGPFVGLTVADTGEGMSVEVAKRAFEPFFTTKGAGRGTGLGLATVYGIARQHGGAVALRSEPGRGTVVKLYLPAEPAAEPAVAAPRAPTGAAVPPAGILIVEDEPAVRGLAQRILEGEGHRVVVARDGAEALALAGRADTAFDLLLTDVVMPLMSGKELAERLTAMRPGLRVVYMSGYPGDLLHGVGPAGGTLLVTKPFTARALVEKVREALRAREGAA